MKFNLFNHREKNTHSTGVSLSGQWTAQYNGSTAGIAVFNFDELSDRFEGTAVAWSQETNPLNAFARIKTKSKENFHQLKDVPLHQIDSHGDFVAAQNQTVPATADIDLKIVDDKLEFSWKTSAGGSCSGVAHPQKTKLRAESELTSVPTKGWHDFKEKIHSLEYRRYIFRGQEDSRWRLRTSFHRTGRANLEKFATNDIPDLHRATSNLLPSPFNMSDNLQFAAFINLAQHHGYPTPLLDWTWSPYVAAFFAYRNDKSPHHDSERKIRIYKLDIVEWNKLLRANKLFPFPQNVSVLSALALGNPRAIPQQSISTMSNVDDIESHIKAIETLRNQTYLEVYDLPANHRGTVMKELALMNITAGSLFPGLDGTCESLREQNF